MDKQTKTKYLLIRVSPDEKADLQEIAKANGFDSLSTFVLWAVRKQRILLPNVSTNTSDIPLTK